MYYTVFTVIVYLLMGAPKVAIDFNPVLMAFVVALVVDLFVNGKVLTMIRPRQQA